jgi:Cys-tRNA(Pro)/Cys-tRNA(Cys) deacylase
VGRSARPPGGTPAVAALTAAGIAFTARAFDADPAAQSYGLEAARALGADPARVLKTILVETAAGPAVGVVPVDRRLDLKAIAAALGTKRAEVAEPRAAERPTGYVVGGISPVGQRRALPTVIDESAFAHPTVLVSGGRRGLDLELAPADLLRATSGTRAPIAR